ncbi:MAG: TIGR01620 family protein [Pseudomonadota bacterium]
MSGEETPKRRGPRLIETGLEDLPPAPESPAEAPPVEDPAPTGAAATAVTAAAARPAGGALARIFWAALVALLTMALGLWAWELVEALIARNVWLGRIALALAAIVFGALLIGAMREAASFARIGKVEGLRDAASRALATRDRGAAAEVLKGLDGLYKGRPELASGRADMAAREAEVVDGDALIELAERSLMAPLDKAAEKAARDGARDVAAATALLPLPLVDVAATLYLNLRMIRRIAEVYGGRAGWLGSWRLLRAVAAHLVAAGAIAVGDDLIGPALGGGALARVSRRFGEGLVNGALTARIGLAAMEVCRPLPFTARARPGVGALLRGAFKGFGRDQDGA